MQAMIFAAGLGTRLKPLTDTMPKAMVEVGGDPLIKRIILKLKDAGFNRIVVNVHHFAEQITDYLSAQQNFGLDIQISDEQRKLLNTGGGIKHAVHFFDPSSPILIHNVDILSNVDLRRFYNSAKGDATLLVSQRQTKRYLLFNPDEKLRLMGWTNVETHEIRSPYKELDTTTCTPYAFSGIHVFNPSLFPFFNEMPDEFGIIDFYLQYCDRCDIYAYPKQDLQLMDVGKMETIAQAENFIKTL